MKNRARGGDDIYLLYIDHVLFPVAPKKIVTETKVKNTVLTLIDGSEITLPGGRGLKNFSFDLLLPAAKYPFAMYDGEFNPPDYYIEKLEKICAENTPVWLDIYRTLPDVSKAYMTNLLVLPEKLTIEENAENGMDMVAKTVFTEYRSMEAGVIKDDGIAPQKRDDDFETPYTYTIKQGDTLWTIAKIYLGSGDKYPYLIEINGLKAPYTILPGQVIKLRGD